MTHCVRNVEETLTIQEKDEVFAAGAHVSKVVVYISMWRRHFGGFKSFLKLFSIPNNIFLVFLTFLSCFFTLSSCDLFLHSRTHYFTAYTVQSPFPVSQALNCNYFGNNYYYSTENQNIEILD